MKICLINKTYSNPTWDGISTYTHILADGLVKLNHKVEIITRVNKNKPEPSKIKIHALKSYFPNNKFFNALNDFLFSIQVFLKFRKINRLIDVVESPEVGAEGFWISIFSPKKLITKLHTPSYLIQSLNGLKINWRRRFLYGMEKYQIEHSALLSSPTRSLASVISRDLGIRKKIYVIPNPYKFREIQTNKKIKSDYILFFGRIEKRKGINIFFKAVEKVIRVFPNLKIFVLGDIDMTYNRRDLEKIPPNVKKNLILLGGKKHHQTIPYLKFARLIILPSIWENFPYTLLESLSLGKVVVVSDCGGFKEIIKNGYNGFLVKPNSSDRLALKIIECLKLNDEKIREIAVNAKTTASKYSPEKIVPEMVNLYESLNEEN